MTPVETVVRLPALGFVLLARCTWTVSETFSSPILTAIASGKWWRPQGLFRPSPGMERAGLAGTAGLPRLQRSVTLEACTLITLETSSLPTRITNASGKSLLQRGIFRPWRGMELEDSAAMAARPPALQSVNLSQYLWTAQATSFLLRRMWGTTIASGKWWPPRELFRRSPEMEQTDLAATAARPLARRLVFQPEYL